VLLVSCFRLNEFLEFADEIVVDVPKLWPYIAEVVGKYVESVWAAVTAMFNLT
jgi:hypothetical protein